MSMKTRNKLFLPCSCPELSIEALAGPADTSIATGYCSSSRCPAPRATPLLGLTVFTGGGRKGDQEAVLSILDF